MYMQVTFPNGYPLGLKQAAEAMLEVDGQQKITTPLLQEIKDTAEKSAATQVAMQLLRLKEHYQSANPRYFECVRKLQAKYPEAGLFDFLQECPASHLTLERLQRLFEFVSQVYQIVFRTIEMEAAQRDDQSQLLASRLYEVLQQTALLESAKQATSNVTKGIIAGATAAVAGLFFSFWLPPVAFIAGTTTGYSFLRLSSGDPVIMARRRKMPLEFKKLGESEHVRIAFEPESSGIINHYIWRIPSQTLGEVQIDVGGEPYQSQFNLNAKHPIEPAEVQRLHGIMLRRLAQKTLRAASCLQILDTLQKIPPPRDASRPKVTLLDPQLVTCLGHVHQKVQEELQPFSLEPLAVSTESLTLYNVPGYHMSCGLFALTLGAIKAHKKYSRVATNVPKDILEWPEEWLSSENSDAEILDQMHRRLRHELTVALRSDPKFKARRQDNLELICLNGLMGIDDVAEFSTLVGSPSNQASIDAVKKAIDPKKYVFTAEEIAEHVKAIMDAKMDVGAAALDPLKKMVQSQSELASSDLDRLLDALYTDVKNPLERLIKRRKCLSLVSSQLPREKNKQWQRACKDWLKKACFEIMKNSPETVKLLAVLLSMEFHGTGAVYTIAYDRAVYGECLSLLVAARMVGSRDQLFENYVEYLKTEERVLTADELKRIAKQWKINVSVYDWIVLQKKPELPYENKLHVFVTNPSKGHWMTLA